MKHMMWVAFFLLINGIGEGNAAMRVPHSLDENEAALILAQQFAGASGARLHSVDSSVTRSPKSPRRVGMVLQPAEGRDIRSVSRVCATNIAQICATDFFMAPGAMFSGMPGIEAGWTAGSVVRRNSLPSYYNVPAYGYYTPPPQGYYNAPAHGYYTLPPQGYYNSSHIGDFGMGASSMGAMPAFPPQGMNSFSTVGASPVVANPATLPLFHLPRETIRSMGSTPSGNIPSLSSVAVAGPVTLENERPVGEVGPYVKKILAKNRIQRRRGAGIRESRILTEDMYKVLNQFQTEKQQDLHRWNKEMVVTFLEEQLPTSVHASTVKKLLSRSGDNKYLTALNQTLNKRKMRLIEAQTEAPWTDESKAICTKLYEEFTEQQARQNLPVTIKGAVKFINERQGNSFVTARAREFLGQVIRREHRLSAE